MIFTKSKNFKTEYCCTPVRIGEILDIEGADLLGKTLVNGFTILVRKDQVKEGDLMFYAPNESQLNLRFLSLNNMFEEKTLNSNPEIKGYFNKYGRVRIIKLKGCYSMGFLFSLKDLQNIYPHIKEEDITIGEDFDTICGELFIKAYIPTIKTKNYNNSPIRKTKKFNCIIPEYFSFHYTTSQLNREIQRINPNDIISISVKLHGSSIILSNSLVNVPIFNNRFYIKILPYLPKFLQFTKQEHRVIYSSRTVIKNSDLNSNVTSGYYNTNIWKEYYDLLKDKIPKDWSIYGEIIGYIPNSSTYIQKEYDYKCSRGTNKLMIYRINSGGYEWNINEVLEWTLKLIKENPELKEKIHPIDLLYNGTLKDLYPDLDINNHWHENVLERLKTESKFGMEKEEPLCKNRVYREGIVLRIDNDPVKEAFKLKCRRFLAKEALEIDKGNVDIEMQQSYE